jgi:hypothetical protein
MQTPRSKVEPQTGPQELSKPVLQKNPRIEWQAGQQRGSRKMSRPVSLLMLNLLILLVAIGAFDFSLSLLNLTEHWTTAHAGHPTHVLGLVANVLASFLLTLVSGFLINRSVRRLKAMLPPQPVVE